MVCIEGVVRLVSVALRDWEEFRKSPSFLALFQALLDALLRTAERETVDCGQFVFVCN